MSLWMYHWCSVLLIFWSGSMILKASAVLEHQQKQRWEQFMRWMFTSKVIWSQYVWQEMDSCIIWFGLLRGRWLRLEKESFAQLNCHVYWTPWIALKQDQQLQHVVWHWSNMSFCDASSWHWCTKNMIQLFQFVSGFYIVLFVISIGFVAASTLILLFSKSVKEYMEQRKGNSSA